MFQNRRTKQRAEFKTDTENDLVYAVSAKLPKCCISVTNTARNTFHVVLEHNNYISFGNKWCSMSPSPSRFS